MSGPAIIPGKRFSPWRYFMNSILINRFSVVAMWFCMTGMAMAAAAASGHPYLFFSGFPLLALGFWVAQKWEDEREENENAARPVSGAVDDDETLDLDRRLRPGVD